MGAPLKAIKRIIKAPVQKPPPPQTVAAARTMYKDSEGKNYDTKEGRDEGQLQLDRQNKFPVEGASGSKKLQIRRASAGRPNVTSGAIGGIGRASGVSISRG